LPKNEKNETAQFGAEKILSNSSIANVKKGLNNVPRSNIQTKNQKDDIEDTEDL
jgi:hypothetical protein